MESLTEEQRRWEESSREMLEEDLQKFHISSIDEQEDTYLYYIYGDLALRRTLVLINMYYDYDFYNWVESLNYKDESGKSRLPDLSQCKGLTAKSIHCLTNGYAFEGTMTNARYQIQVELQYIKEVNDGKGSNTETRNR